MNVAQVDFVQNVVAITKRSWYYGLSFVVKGNSGMTKRYSRNIFSGKEVPYIGISEGHGKLFRGNSVEFSMNLGYMGSIESRDGASRDEEFNGTVHQGISGRVRGICAGREILAENVR